MENAIVSLISTALIILCSVIMMTSTLQATSTMAVSLQAMSQEFSELNATAISAETDNYYGGSIEVRIVNDGQNNLYDFSKWDVIAQYAGGTATYLEYVTGTSAGANQWAVAGINISPIQVEIFDPGILNPAEYLRLKITLDPELTLGESARITVASPSGIQTQCLVTRKAAP